MIEVISRSYKFRGYKDKVVGFTEDKQYFDNKRNLIGYLDINVYKLKDGYPILSLNDDGAVIDEDGENTGYLEGETFNFTDMPSNYSRRSFSKSKGEIYNYKDMVIGYLKGNIENFTDLDYFGILTSFFELGA